MYKWNSLIILIKIVETYVFSKNNIHKHSVTVTSVTHDHLFNQISKESVNICDLYFEDKMVYGWLNCRTPSVHSYGDTIFDFSLIILTHLQVPHYFNRIFWFSVFWTHGSYFPCFPWQFIYSFHKTHPAMSINWWTLLIRFNKCRTKYTPELSYINISTSSQYLKWTCDNLSHSDILVYRQMGFESL